MSSVETPILTSDGIPEEEKIILKPEHRNWPALIFIIFWCMCALGMTVFVAIILPEICCVPALFIVFGVSMIGIFENGSEVTINNKNHTLRLEKKKLCNCCCKKAPRIIDLNQIQKINIYSISNIGNMGPNLSYILTYKNGTVEDISNYFIGCSQESLVDCQNLLKKYLPVENIINQMSSDFPQGFPGYNPNMIQGTPQYYNQQNYNTNGNINVNNNVAGNNENNNVQQNLPIDEVANKPESNTENYGPPELPK